MHLTADLHLFTVTFAASSGHSTGLSSSQRSGCCASCFHVAIAGLRTTGRATGKRSTGRAAARHRDGASAASGVAVASTRYGNAGLPLALALTLALAFRWLS